VRERSERVEGSVGGGAPEVGIDRRHRRCRVASRRSDHAAGPVLHHEVAQVRAGGQLAQHAVEVAQASFGHERRHGGVEEGALLYEAGLELTFGALQVREVVLPDHQAEGGELHDE